MTYYANSKQVLHGKAHVCDAVDEVWAARIVGALNYCGLEGHGTDHVNKAASGTETEQRCGLGNASASSDGLASSIPAPAATIERIADHLDAEAARRPRRRKFTQGIRFAAQNWAAPRTSDTNGPGEHGDGGTTFGHRTTSAPSDSIVKRLRAVR